MLMTLVAVRDLKLTHVTSKIYVGEVFSISLVFSEELVERTEGYNFHERITYPNTCKQPQV